MGKNILITNLASPANPGDQAILRGTLKLIRRFQPDASVSVSTRAYSEKTVYEMLGCRVFPSYPDVDCMAMNDSIKKALRIPQALLRPDRLYNAVKEADLVLLAGGAYFYSYRKLSPGLTFLAHVSSVLFAKKLGKPVVFLPQSYGPFYSKTADSLFRYSAERASYVYFREWITGHRLEKDYPAVSARALFMPDMALYLDGKDLSLPEKRPARTTPLIGLTLRPWQVDNKDASDYFKILGPVLADFVRRHGAVIRIIVQVMDQKDAEGDEGVSRRFAAELEKELKPGQVELFVREPYFNLEELCRLYQECDGMISMRLHSALLSYVAGVPAAVVGYQHKAEGILEAAGLKEFYLGSFDEVKADALNAYLDNVLQKRETLSAQVAEGLDGARAEIEEQGKRFLL